VLPALLLLCYIGAGYAIAPLNILSSFSICALVVFALMLSMGVMLGALSEPMVEQTMLVKLRRPSMLYMGKALLLTAVALVFALITAFLPLLLHVLGGSHLFYRPVVFSDIVSGIMLFFLCGLSGGALGLLVSPRLVPSRKAAVLLSALIGLIAVAKGALIHALPVLKYPLVLLPPIYDACAAAGAEPYFSLGHAWPAFLWLTAYAAAEIAAYVLAMRAKRFE
jgi:hypothetical protein